MSQALPPDVNLGPMILGVHWSFFAICVILVALRFYVRTRLRPGNLGWDDWIALLALGFALACGIQETLAIKAGVGRHIVFVNKANIPSVSKYLWLVSSFNHLGTMTVKVSVCIFLLRMVQQASKIVTRLVALNLIVLIPCTTAIVLINFLQCIPARGFWDRSVDARCIDPSVINGLQKASMAIMVATDFMTATIPIFIIYHLQMRRARKISLALMMSLGYLAAGCGIATAITIKWTAEDFTWDDVPVGYWSALQLELGLTVACIPTLRPLFTFLRNEYSSARNNVSTSNPRLARASSPLQRTISRFKSTRTSSNEGLVLQDLEIQKTTELCVERKRVNQQGL